MNHSLGEGNGGEANTFHREEGLRVIRVGEKLTLTTQELRAKLDGLPHWNKVREGLYDDGGENLRGVS